MATRQYCLSKEVGCSWVKKIPPVSSVNTCSTGSFHPPSRTAAAEVNKNMETLKWLLLVSAKHLLSDTVCAWNHVTDLEAGAGGSHHA